MDGMTIKSKCSLRISRFSSTQEPYYGVRIQVTDDSSRVILAEIACSEEEFGRAVLGLLVDELPFETWTEDDRIGKTRRSELRTIDAPFAGYSRESYEKWLDENVRPTLPGGHTMSTYLGSQGSVAYLSDEGIARLRYTVYWYE